MTSSLVGSEMCIRDSCRAHMTKRESGTPTLQPSDPYVPWWSPSAGLMSSCLLYTSDAADDM
eukprot:6954405-Prorocentrum_lima.AAC.1